MGITMAMGVAAGLAVAALAAGQAAGPPSTPATRPAGAFIRISPRDSRYLELTDGRPYLPIGLNMIGPPGAAARAGAEEGLAGMEAWLKKLADNGGNFARIWLSNPFWDVEHRRSGQYDADKARRIDSLLAIARRHNVRLKLCIEHFRNVDPASKNWANKPLHHVSQGGPAKDMADWLANPACRSQFKGKLAWYAARYGDDPIIFGWELWNEMSAVRTGQWHDWTKEMLPELRRLFPRNLVMQSLGSFDREQATASYRQLALMQGNDLAQVHRYLDLGASLEVCRGPVDILAADAVRTILSFRPGRPVLLAESGAVEPRHTGPFKLYQADKAGIILHDVLFAPFFAGAAGPGHVWHWDAYVDRMDLWHHFGRFAEAVGGLDPPAEGFEPAFAEQPPLRVYALNGRRTFLAWCRDGRNDWKNELAEGKPPEPIRGLMLDLAGLGLPPDAAKARTYDPWGNRWADATLAAGKVPLPDFTRSIVVRITRGP